MQEKHNSDAETQRRREHQERCCWSARLHHPTCSAHMPDKNRCLAGGNVACQVRLFGISLRLCVSASLLKVLPHRMAIQATRSCKTPWLRGFHLFCKLFMAHECRMTHPKGMLSAPSAPRTHRVAGPGTINDSLPNSWKPYQTVTISPRTGSAR